MSISAKVGAHQSCRSFIALLAAATVYSVVPTAPAQYHYVPSRDYYRNDTLEGTVMGGALGALTGAMVGGKKDRGEGALIGAGVGAVAGNLIGRSKDRADEYRTAVGVSATAQANRYAAARAVTNSDLIRLTQAGVGDDVIVSTLRARGARLDLSPHGLISLKENGVSDRVLIAAQELTQRYSAPVPTRIIEPAPPTVIVTQPPYPYHYHYGPRYRPYPRARVHYHFRF